jgi:hypothetical protein
MPPVKAKKRFAKATPGSEVKLIKEYISETVAAIKLSKDELFRANVGKIQKFKNRYVTKSLSRTEDLEVFERFKECFPTLAKYYVKYKPPFARVLRELGEFHAQNTSASGSKVACCICYSYIYVVFVTLNCT